MAEPLRVLLADDHTLVLEGIRAFLSTRTDIEVVGDATDAEAAIARARELEPDVALVDLVMPQGGGVAATRGILASSPRTAVVILTSFGDSPELLPAIEAGARGYVLKHLGADRLADTLHRVARGERVIDPEVAARLAAHLAEGARAHPGDRPTQREREVLDLVAEGLTNADIARALGVSEKTVKTHVSHLLQKLDLDDRTQLAVYAWRRKLGGSQG